MNRILSYKIAQFVGNAVRVYTSGHMDCPTALHKGVACGRGPERVWRAQHGPACASTLTEPRSGDSKQGQDDTERSEVSACVKIIDVCCNNMLIIVLSDFRWKRVYDTGLCTTWCWCTPYLRDCVLKCDIFMTKNTH